MIRTCTPMTMLSREFQRWMYESCRPSRSQNFESAPERSAPRDLADTMLAAGSFKILISAAISAGLAEAMKGTGPFTVFAPPDSAFAGLPKGTLEELLKPENKARLQAALGSHVVPARIDADELLNVRSVKTMGGNELKVRVGMGGISGGEFRGTLRIGDAVVTRADVICTNGIIHVIDRVLV